MFYWRRNLWGSIFQLSRENEWIKSVGSLNPKSKHFCCLSPILSHYSNILPQCNLENEISTEDDKSRHQLIDPVKEAFPVLRECSCLLIAMTLRISTATVERSFICLHRLKTYLCSTMSQQRLDDLAILYIKNVASFLGARVTRKTKNARSSQQKESWVAYVETGTNS